MIYLPRNHRHRKRDNNKDRKKINLQIEILLRKRNPIFVNCVSSVRYVIVVCHHFAIILPCTHLHSSPQNKLLEIEWYWFDDDKDEKEGDHCTFGFCSTIRWKIVQRFSWSIARCDFSNASITPMETYGSSEGQSKHFHPKTNHVLKIKRYGWCIFNRFCLWEQPTLYAFIQPSNGEMDLELVRRTLQSIPFYFNTLKRYVYV